MPPEEKIAKILRADKHSILNLEKRLAAVTGKTDVFEKIIEENEKLMRDRLLTLDVSRDANSKEIYDALISKIDADDQKIFAALGNPDYRNPKHCQAIAETAKNLVGNPEGFFLKLEKAREFIIKEPPRQTMEFLGYDSAEKMLANEDLLEVYSSLRFIEGSEWLNGVFFKQYESLKPEDFEIRPVQVRALGEKWGKEAEKFVIKKKHNLSHLKELGVVFVIPVMLGIDGEILRMVALLMHYLHEIPFYSSIFRKIAADSSTRLGTSSSAQLRTSEKTFSRDFISLLRGDVIENRLIGNPEKSLWLVVQRYLAKDDENDWRLFAPHLNPEAIHWRKAEESLPKLGERLDGFSEDLKFWSRLDWVGDFFRDEAGVEVLVSFNLVDTVMSLVKEKEMVKYLYHHQEALWNEIFSGYFGEDRLEEYARDNLLRGFFEI